MVKIELIDDRLEILYIAHHYQLNDFPKFFLHQTKPTTKVFVQAFYHDGTNDQNHNPYCGNTHQKNSSNGQLHDTTYVPQSYCFHIMIDPFFYCLSAMMKLLRCVLDICHQEISILNLFLQMLQLSSNYNKTGMMGLHCTKKHL